MRKTVALILLTAFMKWADAQLGNAAHGGGAGNYVYNAFEPCSPARPNAEGAVRVKLERRQQGITAWQEIATLTAPENLGQLTAQYHRFQKFGLAPEFLHPEVLPALWEKYKSAPRWDSLGIYMNERTAALAMAFLYVDTAAPRNIMCEYQLSAIDRAGKVISSKTSNTAAWPDAAAFPSAPVVVRAEGDPYGVQIDWSMKGGKRPQFFKVYRKGNALDAFEFIGNQFNITRQPRTDSVYMYMKDVSVADNQVYYYYVVAVDGYGNESKSSDTVVAKTYNTKDLLLPQFFIARYMPAGAGVQLTWKIVAEQSVSAIELFRSDAYDGEYKSVGFATGEDTSFIDHSIKPAKIYYYYMQVTDRFQHLTSRSARTPVVFEDTRAPRKVRNLIAAVVNGKVQVSWTTIEKNIAGYYVYRSVGMDTNYALVSTFLPAKDSLSVFVDESNALTSPYGYSYVVVQENTSHVGSGYSAPFYLESVMSAAALPAPSQLEVQLVNGRLMLTWLSMQTVSGVSGYNVLRKVNGTGTFEKINTYPLGSGTNFYTDSLVKPGNTYEYTVQVLAASGVAGASGTTVSFNFETEPLMPPAALSAVQVEKGIQLSWELNEKEGAKEVNIYRANRGDKEAMKLSAVPAAASTYTDYQAQAGKSYFYYVTSRSASGVESAKSDVKFVTVD